MSSQTTVENALLSDEKTFHALKKLYDANPGHEETKRMFTSVLGSYIGNQLSAESDEFQNLKNKLKVNVEGLDLSDKDGKPLSEVLYEDISEWLKKLDDKTKRQAVYNRMAEAYTRHLAPRFTELFKKENKMLADLGYPDVVGFYSATSGHDLPKLAQSGKALVSQTQELYTQRMSEFYKKRTGVDFSQATRADISYVLHGKLPEMESINARFPESNMIPLAQKTFDGLGLDFSTIAQTIDFKTKDDYQREVVEKTESVSQSGGARTLRRILLDIAKREGKRSRAYVYPAQVPAEIYLSGKPEGGLDDYSAFFHESGHAQHFAYEAPDLSFAKALMGNNTTTEAYAYLMQNLFLNRHWLENMAGLSNAEALQVVSRGALNDLYMLRRYASKMQFEVFLYEGINEKASTPEEVSTRYAELLTLGCGFVYDQEGWTRDVDAGFYVADYFTAWSLEAQLREYLCRNFDTKPDTEDWYKNPEAGEFLKALWKDGNLNQKELSARLGYNNPNDIGPLVRFMERNLG